MLRGYFVTLVWILALIFSIWTLMSLVGIFATGGSIGTIVRVIISICLVFLALRISRPPI